MTTTTTTTPAEAKDYGYFHERLDPLGWTPEGNIVHVPAELTGNNTAIDYPLFDADAEGNLVIPYYRITGHRAEYRKGEDKWGKHYQVLRLRVPQVDPNGKVKKYRHPGGTGTLPWFAPNVIEAYQQQREIEVLVMVEGALKAYAGSSAGVYMVGIPGINNAKDRATSTLHGDIIDLLKVCRPKDVVWLQDGDCRDLSRQWPEKPETDLYKRPNDFFVSARNMGVLLKDYARQVGFSTWYMHVVSTSVQVPEKTEPPKGLDDLLLAYQDAKVREAGHRVTKDSELLLPSPEKQVELRAAAVQEVATDLTTFSGPNRFFERRELDRPDRMREYFHLRSEDSFYAAYQERIGDLPFVYNGTKYQWNEEAGELKVLVPSTAKKYVRVGIDYYRWVRMRDPRTKKVQEVLKKWSRPTIIEDEGKHFLGHILKYDAFTCVPDHVAYEKSIDNCLNSYAPFTHVPDHDADPPVRTLAFLEHIFGNGEVQCAHPKRRGADGAPEMIKVNELDLGLDYLKLLYEQPMRMLPIFCPVSKERGTGKSTFFNWLHELFGDNAVFIGAKDLEENFNFHYASKKIIIIDEALVSKQESVEKLKALSTSINIMVNNKGVTQYPQPFFGVFLLGSNNVRNFIRTDDDETRFWVRTIPVIKAQDLDVDLLSVLRDEIPAFLGYLQSRPMATENLYRSWFHPPLLMTDALREVRKQSTSTVKRLITDHVRVIFFAKPELQEILMTAKDLKNELFKGHSRVDEKYIREVVKDEMQVEPWRNHKGEKATTPYGYWRFVDVRDGAGGPSVDLQYQHVKVSSRPYAFHRQAFMTADDEAIVRELVDPNKPEVQTTQPQPAMVAADDLPF